MSVEMMVMPNKMVMIFLVFSLWLKLVWRKGNISAAISRVMMTVNIPDAD